MEHTERLVKITNDYAKILEGADKVSSIKESDELKIKALGYWKELQRQLNRAYREMLQITRETRARVAQESYQATIQSVRETVKAPVEAPKAKGDEANLAQKTKDAPKVKKIKKSKK